ncbi:MAG: hypothetical protein LBB89_06280 [Treponema sp.]|jgi:hypothetical protein|nr:hypothetical protein [Treponema sp.]
MAKIATHYKNPQPEGALRVTVTHREISYKTASGGQTAQGGKKPGESAYRAPQHLNNHAHRNTVKSCRI